MSVRVTINFGDRSALDRVVEVLRRAGSSTTGLKDDELQTIADLSDAMRLSGAALMRGSTKPLTKRQYEILTFLTDYTDSHGYAPNQQEIADRMGFRSLGSVHEQLEHLAEKGYIKHEYNRSRGITVIVRPEAPKLESVV